MFWSRIFYVVTQHQWTWQGFHSVISWYYLYHCLYLYYYCYYIYVLFILVLFIFVSPCILHYPVWPMQASEVAVLPVCFERIFPEVFQLASRLFWVYLTWGASLCNSIYRYSLKICGLWRDCAPSWTLISYLTFISYKTTLVWCKLIGSSLGLRPCTLCQCVSPLVMSTGSLLFTLYHW
jgi:hypothetical protein